MPRIAYTMAYVNTFFASFSKKFCESQKTPIYKAFLMISIHQYTLVYTLLTAVYTLLTLVYNIIHLTCGIVIMR